MRNATAAVSSSRQLILRKNTRRLGRNRLRGNRLLVPRGAIGYLEFRRRSRHGFIDFPIVRALVPVAGRLFTYFDEYIRQKRSRNLERASFVDPNKVFNKLVLISILIERLIDESYKVSRVRIYKLWKLRVRENHNKNK